MIGFHETQQILVSPHVNSRLFQILSNSPDLPRIDNVSTQEVTHDILKSKIRIRRSLDVVTHEIDVGLDLPKLFLCGFGLGPFDFDDHKTGAFAHAQEIDTAVLLQRFSVLRELLPQ